MRSGSCCILLLASALSLGGAPAGPIELDLRIPAKHPYLALTASEAARAKARAGESQWARDAFDKAVNDARRHIVQPWGKLPGKGDTEHRAIANRLFSVALAHALTGEQQFAAWTRDGLLAYAAIYPGLPITNLRSKMFTQSPLFEATWLVQMAQAYDLVADSGAFTAAQKSLVERDLLRAALVCLKIDDFQNDPRIRDLHYRCYNFQAWHLSAIGLVGLAVRDPALVDYAVNSPYGFRHLVAHDIRDDGLFWERSVGYHQFVVAALLPFTEAMARCGVDLYRLTFPNDRSKDEDAHYITDTTAAPKSLRLMWEAPLYLAFPDLSYPALGDGDRGPLRINWQHLAGYHRYRDPKLAWLLRRNPAGNRDWRWLIYDAPPESQPAPAFPLADGGFANSGRHRNGCTLFPSSGVAVLREAAGDFTRDPEMTAVSLSYGPYGGGHGHPDKLNLVLYAHGRQWLPDFGSMPYETRWKAEWTAHTVSHNTVVINGISQQPSGARNSQWPVDDATRRVLGNLVAFEPAAKLASAACNNAYDGYTIARTVQLCDHVVLDDYSISPAVSAAAPAQFDYVLHVDGQLTDSSLRLIGRDGRLGERAGYQHIGRLRAAASEGPAALTFQEGNERLKVWVLSGAKTPSEVIVGEGLTNKPDATMPVLVVRRNALQTRFVTVLEPVRTSRPLRSARLEPRVVVLEYADGSRRVPLRSR